MKELIERIKNWFKNLGKSNNYVAISEKNGDNRENINGVKGEFLDGDKVEKDFHDVIKVRTTSDPEQENEEIRGEIFDYADEFLEKKDNLRKLCNEVNQLISKYRMVANKEIFLDEYGKIDEYKKEYRFKIEQDMNYKVDYVKTEENVINSMPAKVRENLIRLRKKPFKDFFISKVQGIEKVPYNKRSRELIEIDHLYRTWGKIQSLVGELMGMQKATLDHYSDLDERYEKKRTRNW